MKCKALLLGLAIAACLQAMAKDDVLPIKNGGFEDGLAGWTIEEAVPMSSLSTDRAASGKCSLRIVDEHGECGSNARASRIPIPGAGAYVLCGKLYPVSGFGLGVYVRILDKDGKSTVAGDGVVTGLGGSDKKWCSFRKPFYTSDDAAYLELWIHSYNSAKVEAYLDDLHFVRRGPEALKPPWEGSYKIRPEETNRLTASDVVGPDGIVYPDWTRCGVQAAVPAAKAVAFIEDFGGEADDDADDHEALDAACRAVGEMGGGAVLLGEGTYYLGRPVTVRHNHVVIRGQGMNRTRLIFRYALPDEGMAFYNPPAGSRVGKNTPIELHCMPKGLVKVVVSIDNVVLREWNRGLHSGNSFAVGASPSKAFEKLKDGPHKLRGVAHYLNTKKTHTEIDVILDSGFNDERVVSSSRAAISFQGRGLTGPKLKLAQDGKRGDTRLVLENVEGLAVGDRIMIDGPATERWKKLTLNACRWGTYRRNAYAVEAIDGKTIVISQPLRIEFPVVDGSYVQKMETIEGCGIENLYMEQTEDLWITTVEFRYAWNCLGRGVKVRKCGRNPIYGAMAKWCEIRDCVFDDAWFKGGGGTAYTGWDHSWDCLMENVETFKFRHAPLYQWSASGNVIRKSVFHLSDGQWHSGWTNENLFEQCVITSVRGHGGYGYGMWASPPEDTAHGPNGPRNVVYNCDVRSQKAGLWMGGMNENWLILHNRFVVESGCGVVAKTASFDHVIRGNVFVLKDRKWPMVFLATPDCIGVELIGNALYGGNGSISAGWGKPAKEVDNKALPLAEAPRPQPAVPSIYEWQLTHAR